VSELVLSQISTLALNIPCFCLHSQVPEYTDLRKPKHHMAAHVVRDIELNGPPRAWWCMAFEAFNQVIKNMFKRSNYKSATLSVANFWSMRSARALRQGRTCAWYQDSACPASELSTDVGDMCTCSTLMSETCVDDVVAAQQLHSFTRGSVAVRVGAWVLVESTCTPGSSYIAQISEIAQLFTAEAWHIRMLACEVVATPASIEGVWMSVPAHELQGQQMVIDAEAVHISELSMVRSALQCQFRLVW
jgi:hypothetical protein